jgi:hypothetical protein
VDGEETVMGGQAAPVRRKQCRGLDGWIARKEEEATVEYKGSKKSELAKKQETEDRERRKQNKTAVKRNCWGHKEVNFMISSTM